MPAQSNVSVSITANDKTKSGVDAALKRLNTIPTAAGKGEKEVSAIKRALDGVGSTKTQSGLGRALKNLTSIDKAAASAFGRSSALGGVTKRLGAIEEAAAKAGPSLAMMVSEASALEVALASTVGVAAAAATGYAALTYAGYKFADGWAKGAASLGRLSQTLGISTKAMQEFQLVGARYGISGDAVNGGVADFAQHMYNARYGRDPATLQLMKRLGMNFRYNKDGTLDYSSMMQDLSQGISLERDPMAAKQIADMTGTTALLPMLRMGRAGLQREFKDVNRFGPMASTQDIKNAQAMEYNGVVISQGAERAKVWAQRKATERTLANQPDIIAGERVALIGASALHRVVTGDFAPASSLLHTAGRTLSDAVKRLDDIIPKTSSGTAGGVAAALARTPSIGARLAAMPSLASMGGGLPPGKAAVQAAILRAAAETGNDPATMLAIAQHESRLNPSIRPPLINGRRSSAVGLFQFLDGTWLEQVRAHGSAHGLGWAANSIVRRGRGWTIADPAMRARVLGLRTDPYLNAVIAGEMMRDQNRGLAAQLGHAPDAGEQYAANFLGAGGARRFFRLLRANPNASAAAAFPAESGDAGNRGMFYDRSGHARSLSDVLSALEQAANRIADHHTSVSVTAPHGTKVKVEHPSGATSFHRSMTGHGPLPISQ